MSDEKRNMLDAALALDECLSNVSPGASANEADGDHEDMTDLPDTRDPTALRPVSSNRRK